MYVLELSGLVYPLKLVSSRRDPTREPLGGDIDADNSMSDAL